MIKEKSYSSVFKATSVFGGVQVFVIIVGIIREKIIAILLGPIGIGTIGVLSNLITLVYSLIGFGVPTSSIKFIAEKEKSKERVIFIVRRIILITAVLGLILTILFASEISYMIFKNDDKSYIYSIMITGFAVLFYGLESGELAVLQANRKIKDIAKARIFSSLLGLILTIPIYYVWRIDGIAYSLVVIYLINCLVIFYFSSDYKLQLNNLKIKEFIFESKSIIKLGFFISLSALIIGLVNFISKYFILSIGSFTDLGYYETGNKLVSGYVGVVFVAMAKDYFPRISTVNKNNVKIEELANTQIEVAFLFLMPILVIFSVSVEFILKILYSNDFIIVKSYIYIAILGLIFKLVSWTLSYIVLAKGESFTFFLYEFTGGCILLIANYSGFKYYGLQGLGIAFLIYNIIYCIILLIINKIKFNIQLRSKLLVKLVLFIFFNTLIIFINAFLFSSLILNSLFVIFSLIYSVIVLNNQMDIFKMLKK
jgi:O-antigen/teichoic acid export membrane protein